MIKIKVCGMRDPGNIKEISALKPDYMGFIFYRGSVRYAGTDSHSVVRKCCTGIIKTGVFVNESLSGLLKIARLYDLNIIQLHGNENPEFCYQVKEEGYLVIKSFPLIDTINEKIMHDYAGACDYFLFDRASESFGGSGKKFRWELLEKYTINKPFFLSGGIKAGDAALIKELYHPWLHAADINSGFESGPGIKDPVRVKEFMDILKNR
jgi:phosphoribosylanthranilate isomerase